MTILIDVNTLIEEATALTTVAKPVGSVVNAAARPIGSTIANLGNSVGKTWNKLSPMAKTAAVGLGGLGVTGLGLAAGHTLGAAAFAPAANLLHLAPASGALHTLNPATAPIALGAAMTARRAIQNHYNG